MKKYLLLLSLVMLSAGAAALTPLLPFMYQVMPTDSQSSPIARARWTAKIDPSTEVTDGFLLQNSNLYLIADGKLEARQVNSGKLLWRAGRQLVGSLAQGADLIIATTTEKRIVAFNKTGQQVWETPKIVAAAENTPYAWAKKLLADEKALIVNTSDGLYAYQLKTGKLLWRRHLLNAATTALPSGSVLPVNLSTGIQSIWIGLDLISGETVWKVYGGDIPIRFEKDRLVVSGSAPQDRVRLIELSSGNTVRVRFKLDVTNQPFTPESTYLSGDLICWLGKSSGKQSLLCMDRRDGKYDGGNRRLSLGTGIATEVFSVLSVPLGSSAAFVGYDHFMSLPFTHAVAQQTELPVDGHVLPNGNSVLLLNATKTQLSVINTGRSVKTATRWNNDVVVSFGDAVAVYMSTKE